MSVGNKPRSPYEGVKKSLVFIASLLFASTSNDGPYFKRSWFFTSPEPKIGALFCNGYCASKKSSLSLKANTKPTSVNNPLVNANDNCASV